MLLCRLLRNVDWLLVINTSSSSPVKNKRRRLPATNVNNLPRFVAAECIAIGSRTFHSTRLGQILAENCVIPQLHSTPPLGGGGPVGILPWRLVREEVERFGYPTVKTVCRYVYSFWQNSRTWQTDGRTERHHVTAGRACIASRARRKLIINHSSQCFVCWHVAGYWWLAVAHVSSSLELSTSAENFDRQLVVVVMFSVI